jgi:hypothetical protein
VSFSSFVHSFSLHFLNLLDAYDLCYPLLRTDASAPKSSSSSLINTGGNNNSNNNSYLPVSQNTSPIRQQHSKLDQYHHHHSHSHSQAHQRNPSIPAGSIGNPGKTPDVSLFAQSGSGFSGLHDVSNSNSAAGSRRGSPFPWAGPRQS